MLDAKDTPFTKLNHALDTSNMRDFWRVCDGLKSEQWREIFVEQRDRDGNTLLHKIVNGAGTSTVLLTHLLGKLKTSLAQPKGFRGFLSSLFSPSQSPAEELDTDLGELLNVTNNQGVMPLDLASSHAVAALLIRHGAHFGVKKQAEMTKESFTALLEYLLTKADLPSDNSQGRANIETFCRTYSSILSRPAATAVSASAPNTSASSSSSSGASSVASTAVSSSASAPASIGIDTPVSIDDFFDALHRDDFDKIKDMLTRDATLVKQTRHGKSALQKPFDLIVEVFSSKKFFATHEDKLKITQGILDRQVSIINRLLSIAESFIDTLDMDANNKLAALVFLEETNREKLAILITQAKTSLADSAQNINHLESLNKEIRVMDRLLNLIRVTINKLKQDQPHLQWFDVVKQGNIEKVRALMSLDPKLLSLVDDQGNTALHYAASLKNKALVSMLAKQETVNIRNTEGLTALDITLAGIPTDSGNTEISIALMLAGADVADGNFLGTCDVATLTTIITQLTTSIKEDQHCIESLHAALTLTQQSVEEIKAKIDALKELLAEASTRYSLTTQRNSVCRGLNREIKEQESMLDLLYSPYQRNEEPIAYRKQRIEKVQEALLLLTPLQEALLAGSSAGMADSGLPPVSSAPAETSLVQHPDVTLFQPATSSTDLTTAATSHIRLEQ